jgi:hypothetical protein
MGEDLSFFFKKKKKKKREKGEETRGLFGVTF